LKQDILQEEESNNRILSLNNGICVKCNKPLSRTTFRDINGEVEGWTSECLNCEILYEER
jgi:hypothetical protein